MKAFIYDFRKSFLRASVLTFLAVFALAGVALSYLTLHNLNLKPQVNVIGVALGESNGSVKVIGLVLDTQGRPMQGTQVTLTQGGITVKASTNSSGFFVLQSNQGEWGLNVTSPRGGISGSVALVGNTFVLGSSFSNGYTHGSSGPGGISALLLNLHDGEGILFVASPSYPLDLYYNVTSASLVTSSGKFTYLGTTHGYLSSFPIRINSPGNFLWLKAVGNSLQGGFEEVGFLYSPVSLATSLLIGGIISSVAPFFLLFPVIFLYLVNVLMANPRRTGALEFVLARPVTRFDIYMNRYIAGLLTAVAASALFVGLVWASVKALTGVSFPLHFTSLIFLGLLGSLAAFFSLLYSIASSTRAYLGIGILLYLLFYLLWSLIPLLLVGFSPSYGQVLSVSYYFNPSGAFQFASSVLATQYGLQVNQGASLNPELEVLSPLLWIVIPTVLGYLRFRRANLTS